MADPRDYDEHDDVLRDRLREVDQMASATGRAARNDAADSSEATGFQRPREPEPFFARVIENAGDGTYRVQALVTNAGYPDPLPTPLIDDDIGHLSPTDEFDVREASQRIDVPVGQTVHVFPADGEWRFVYQTPPPGSNSLTVTDGTTTVGDDSVLFFDPGYFDVISGGPGAATVTMGAFPTGSSSPTTAPGPGSPIYYIQPIWNGTTYSDSVFWIWTGTFWFPICPCPTTPAPYIPPGYPSIGTACCPEVPLPLTAAVTFSGAGCDPCLLAGNPWPMTHQLIGSDHYWYTDDSPSDECDAGGGVTFFIKCSSGGAWSSGPGGSSGAGFCFGATSSVTSASCDPLHVQGTIQLAGTGCGTGTVNYDVVAT